MFILDYETICKTIKEVTNLNIPIKYNCYCSPCFGIGDYAFDIIPNEFIDCPMFDINDFLENKHIKFYHISLPKKINFKKNSYIYNYTKKQLTNMGIKIKKFTTEMLEIFIILHEFGHANQLFIEFKEDVEKYNSYHIKHNNSYDCKFLNAENSFYEHKKAPMEQYADSFAIYYFEEVCKKLNIYLN